MNAMVITISEDSFDKARNPCNLRRSGVSEERHSNWGMVEIVS